MSALSYKASNDKLEKQELEELKRKVDSFKNSKEDFEKRSDNTNTKDDRDCR